MPKFTMGSVVTDILKIYVYINSINISFLINGPQSAYTPHFPHTLTGDQVVLLPERKYA